MLQIDRKALGRLVAVVGGLGEQFQHERREWPRDAGNPRVGRRRLPGDVAVHPFHRFGRRERQRSRQHLVENDAERIEIAAGVNRTVHPPGLLRRHVGQRACDNIGGCRYLVLAKQPRGDAETSQPDAAAGRVDEDIGWLEILMDQPPRMQPADGRSERDSNAQEFRHGHRPTKHALKRLATGISQHQHDPDFASEEFDRLRRPVAVEVGPQRVFMLEALQGDG